MSSQVDWNDIAERYPIGQNVWGTVSRVWQVGALVELEPGLRGLLRNSELEWDKRITNAAEVLKVGRKERVQVLLVEPWRKRISVSLKRAKHDPWKEHSGSEKYTDGEVIKARVTKFTRDDILVEFEDYVQGSMSREEVVPWHGKAEDILERGGETVEILVPRGGVATMTRAQQLHLAAAVRVRLDVSLVQRRRL